MASSSSASAMASLGSALGAPPTEKLTRDNHLFWKTQVLPALRGAQVIGLLDGSDKAPAKYLEVEDAEKVKKQVPNDAYDVWLARDQTVMSYLVKGMSADLLAQVVGLEHASEVWATVEDIFASQSRAKVNMLRGALSNTKKLDSTAAQYIAKMKGFVSELAAAGKHVDDDELKGIVGCFTHLQTMLLVALTTQIARPLLHVAAVTIREVPMDARIRTDVMVATIAAAMMTATGAVMMTATGAVMMTATGAVMMTATGAVMMTATGAKNAVMVIVAVGPVKDKGVVLDKAAVVEAVHLPPTRMWSARFARSMVTQQMNVGGAMLIEMTEILAPRRREHMV
ncbi:hypothetical protein QYE76_055902 [Lolium multiflorum]|uniref:Uncharacterized protein n=1 Tax=Lolium multiflorum TaxID=4521 RepID=A0AAD8T292_LOLMU|nr:hypothetical protein QYE76_055902 [Lolium multiflorum]